MLREYLKEAFFSFHAGPGDWRDEDVTGGRCNAKLVRTIEHVVDETDTRIRAIPQYAERLKGPVEKVFHFVDTIVENIPPPISCRSSNYTQDATVRALFAGPDHLKKVFSESENIRAYFREHCDSDDCWALLCMAKEERRQPGMAVINDRVMKDVMQTSVNFTDHQFMSPGTSEQDARCALKSCIFNSLLAYARQEARSTVAAYEEQEARLRTLRQKAAVHDKSDHAGERELNNEILELERSLVGRPLRLMTPRDQLEFVISILENPEQYVSHNKRQIRLSNTNRLLDDGEESEGNCIHFSEISVASHPSRVALLVRFPRSDLLPTPDFSRMADIFLAN